MVTGMRRTGKTTLLQDIYSKVDSKNKLFLDLENPLNQKFFEEQNYERIKQTFESLGLNFAKKAYLFLDEIQTARAVPSVVKYFIDHYQAKFFLTGSASLYLKNLFTESLAGRKYLFELQPLTFREFLAFKESRIQLPRSAASITPAFFELVKPLYEEYVAFGGFPGVVLKQSVAEKKQMLDEIFTSYYQMEVLQIGDFRRNDVIRDLILLLAQRTGTRMDIQKLSVELSISRITLADYLSFLEGTYLIRTIRPFSKGRDTELRKMPKVYFCDSGLANHLARLERGRIFENSVFQNLQLLGELNYYLRKDGNEIDFIVNRKKAFEVKSSPQKTDLSRLRRLTRLLGIRQFQIVSGVFTKLDRTTYGFLL